jgi:hypothetical protein
MTWEVEYTDEFGDWWASLNEDEQVSVAGMRYTSPLQIVYMTNIYNNFGLKE